MNSANGKPVLDLITLDCPDALQLAAFYAELLGWPLAPGSDSSWAELTPPGGGVSPEDPDGRPAPAFQRVQDWEAPTWPGGAHPQQFHLDFTVGDIDAAEPSMLALGARRHDHQPSQDGGFRVHLDPVGHPFCLFR